MKQSSPSMAYFRLSTFFATLFSLLINVNLNAQDLCQKIDSIVVVYIPIKITTTISLDEYEVRNYEIRYRHHSTIIDGEKLSQFVDCKWSEGILMNRSAVDVRAIVEVYGNGIRLHTILMGKSGYFEINKTVLDVQCLKSFMTSLELPFFVTPSPLSPAE